LLYPGQGSQEEVLVQGILDLAFLEAGGWVLVDYKTSRVSSEGPEELLLHYRPQMAIYRAALEKITGFPVKQAGLFLLALGEMAWYNVGDIGLPLASNPPIAE